MKVSATRYEERLRPGATVFLALSLSFPMVCLALAPFGWPLAIFSGIAALFSTCGVAFVLSPIIRVSQLELTAGSIRIPLEVLGKAEVLSQADAKFAKGPGLSPMAAHLIRGDIADLVRIEIRDPQDPTPYLLISTRRPQDLVAALAS